MTKVKRGDILQRYDPYDNSVVYYIFINSLSNGLYNLVELDPEGSAVQLIQLRKDSLKIPDIMPPVLQQLL